MRICSINGCGKKHYANGYCQRHNQHIRRYGKIKTRTKLTPNEFIIEGNICRIKLYNVKNEPIAETIIDTEDYEKCKGIKWWLMNQGYVTSSNGFLHHLILGKKTELEHKTRNRLDNRKTNLRFCTYSQNGINSKIRSDNTSGFRGVCWDKRNKNWMARLYINGKCRNLGRFDSKLKAAKAYGIAALNHFGEFTNQTLKIA